MDVQIMPRPQYERYIRQIHDALPNVHDGANDQSPEQRPSHRIGVLGSAIIDTTKQEWALYDGGAKRKRPSLAELALSYPHEYGELA